jgi:hypothetical protein
MFKDVEVRSRMFRYVPVRSGTFKDVQVRSSTSRCVPVRPSTFQGRSGTFQYVRVTLLFFLAGSLSMA